MALRASRALALCPYLWTKVLMKSLVISVMLRPGVGGGG